MGCPLPFIVRLPRVRLSPFFRCLAGMRFGARMAVLCAAAWILATGVGAEVRVYVEPLGGLAWLKYECTAGEVVRAFALDVTVDRGVILGVSDYVVGESTASARDRLSRFSSKSRSSTVLAAMRR